MLMLDGDDGEGHQVEGRQMQGRQMQTEERQVEGRQVEGHSGAVAVAAVQQEACYKSPVRNRIAESLGVQDGVASQEAARIEEAGVEVVAVSVAVADSGELRAARVVRAHAGKVFAGHVLRRAHLRRH